MLLGSLGLQSRLPYEPADHGAAGQWRRWEPRFDVASELDEVVVPSAQDSSDKHEMAVKLSFNENLAKARDRPSRPEVSS